MGVLMGLTLHLMQMTTYTHKTDLNDVTDRVFENLDILLDSFGIEHEDDRDKVFMACPIHGGDNLKGLSISKERKAWACWTRNCHQEHGQSIFGFVAGVLSTQQNKKATFKNSLDYICNLYKIKSKYKKQPQKTKSEDFSQIVGCIKDIVIETHANKIEPLKLSVPSKYFIKRNFLKETLEYFGVGEMEDKKRAAIPIYDEHQQLIGYILRATKPYLTPKFIFTEGFKKTEHLYNYANALSYAKEKNCFFVVEGQGDVWRLYESGVFNAVGQFGSDLSEIQISLLLQSGVTNLVILADDDEAGREVKFKLQRRLNRVFNLKFPNLKFKDVGDTPIEQVQNDILTQVRGYY